jgi:hypothetical protein
MRLTLKFAATWKHCKETEFQPNANSMGTFCHVYEVNLVTTCSTFLFFAEPVSTLIHLICDDIALDFLLSQLASSNLFLFHAIIATYNHVVYPGITPTLCVEKAFQVK